MGTPLRAVKSAAQAHTPRLIPGNKYLLESAPCPAGETVEYRLNSIDGLDMHFFQMASPALGLFMEVS
jgi:hypothetical protein